jgi:hypothetical protein
MNWHQPRSCFVQNRGKQRRLQCQCFLGRNVARRFSRPFWRGGPIASEQSPRLQASASPPPKPAMSLRMPARPAKRPTSRTIPTMPAYCFAAWPSFKSIATNSQATIPCCSASSRHYARCAAARNAVCWTSRRMSPGIGNGEYCLNATTLNALGAVQNCARAAQYLRTPRSTGSSWPGLSRPSTSLPRQRKQDVDARHKAGHHESLIETGIKAVMGGRRIKP